MVLSLFGLSSENISSNKLPLAILFWGWGLVAGVSKKLPLLMADCLVTVEFDCADDKLRSRFSANGSSVGGGDGKGGVSGFSFLVFDFLYILPNFNNPIFKKKTENDKNKRKREW